MPALLTLLLALLAAVAVFGCGDEEPAGLSGELRYVRSGGIAGIHDELVVQPDGRAKLTARGKGESEFDLTDDELAGLADETAGFEARADVAPKPAPDAFSYTVVYDGQTARTDDPSLAGSGMKPLVVQLEKILQAHGG